jgi:hypothetical protein
VFDFANLMPAIDSLYATYDHINATIEQVQNTYQQLQKQIEAVKQMDWDYVDGSMSDHNGIPDIRDPLNSMNKMVNDNLKLINDVQDTLTKKKIYFGGKSYTFGGLFGFGEGSDGTTIFDMPKNIVDYVMKTTEDVTAGYEGKLTYEQKEAIMRRHNLSPRNYARLRIVEEQSNALLQKMLTTGTGEHAEAEAKRAAENQMTIAQMSDWAGESMVAQQQATTQAILNVAKGITELRLGINNTNGFFAQSELTKQTEKELRAIQEEQRKIEEENDWRKTHLMPEGL